MAQLKDLIVTGDARVLGRLYANTVKEITLGTTWTSDSTNGYVTQTVSCSGITASDSPVLDVKLTGTLSNMTTQETEWAKIKSATTASGSITFIASAATTTSLTVLVKI